MPPIELPSGAIVGANVVAFAGWSLVASTVARRRAFARDTWLTRPRALERDGAAYDRLWIRRWKDRLPEAGGAKRVVGGRDRTTLERFVVETRRAEWVHWVILAAVPLFALWNPPLAMVLVVGVGVSFNLPCLLVQRYNRLRLQRVIRLASSRGRGSR
jgi:glycosyl-4,4'-diaponeurosporenoate acyltransferase